MTANLGLEWSGALLGLLGVGLLAGSYRTPSWGFLPLLLSNACWIAFALRTHTYGLLAMQIGLSLASALDLFRSILIPPLPTSRKKRGNR
ncbi:MAG: hypothetical protein ACTS5I_12400 [Rhodanobacter sp.]